MSARMCLFFLLPLISQDGVLINGNSISGMDSLYRHGGLLQGLVDNGEKMNEYHLSLKKSEIEPLSNVIQLREEHLDATNQNKAVLNKIPLEEMDPKEVTNNQTIQTFLGYTKPDEIRFVEKSPNDYRLASRGIKKCCPCLFRKNGDRRRRRKQLHESSREVKTPNIPPSSNSPSRPPSLNEIRRNSSIKSQSAPDIEPTKNQSNSPSKSPSLSEVTRNSSKKSPEPAENQKSKLQAAVERAKQHKLQLEALEMEGAQGLQSIFETERPKNMQSTPDPIAEFFDGPNPYNKHSVKNKNQHELGPIMKNLHMVYDGLGKVVFNGGGKPHPESTQNTGSHFSVRRLVGPEVLNSELMWPPKEPAKNGEAGSKKPQPTPPRGELTDQANLSKTLYTKNPTGTHLDENSDKNRNPKKSRWGSVFGGLPGGGFFKRGAKNQSSVKRSPSSGSYSDESVFRSPVRSPPREAVIVAPSPSEIRAALERARMEESRGILNRATSKDFNQARIERPWSNKNSPQRSSSPSPGVPTRKTINVAFTDKRDTYWPLDKWPIVYSDEYNINVHRFESIAKRFPYDPQKFKNIINFLQANQMLSKKFICEPLEATEEILAAAHSEKFLKSLEKSSTVARFTQNPIFYVIPNDVIQNRGLRPLRFHVGGTILAGELALHRGWAINIGGGFHHGSAYQTGGFCVYADITILINWLLKHYPQKVEKLMIIDFNAQQGNGPEMDFVDDKRVFIVDIYNPNVYPRRGNGHLKINIKVEVDSHIKDGPYLDLVGTTLDTAMKSFKPDIVIYNAGTDCVTGDHLGQLDVSAEGIIQRDEIVFTKVRKQQIPIVMLTSGGYYKKVAKIIADSIINLKEKGLISL